MHIPVYKSPFIQPLKFKVTEDPEMRKLFQALLLGCFDLWEEEEETGVWAGEVAVQYEGRKKKKKQPQPNTAVSKFTGWQNMRAFYLTLKLHSIICC